MDLRVVVRDSVAAWRKNKHPRLAAVAEWATSKALTELPARPALATTTKKADVEAWQTAFEDRDELDLPRLLAAVPTGRSPISTERVKLLATANDPRVVTWVLRTLEAPPFRAGTAQPFFRACCELLTESNDPRVRPALEDLAARYKGIIETSVGDVIAALLARTARGIDQVKPGPLPAAVERKVTEWEALFETEHTKETRAASTKKAARANDDELLSAIYAAPQDDGPRQVYADSLIERGDERGEFIALQLAKARGGLTPAQREREVALTLDPKRLSAWALPLSAGGDVKFGRGFPETLTVSPKTAKKAVGHEALRTLTHLHGLERASHQVAVELLSAPQLRGATHVGGLTAEHLDDLEGGLPWVSVELMNAPSPQTLTRFTALRALDLHELPATPFEGARSVETLRVRAREITGALFSSVPATRSLELLGWSDDWAIDSLAKLPKLERLSTRWAPPPAVVEGCNLVHLETGWSSNVDLAALLGALKKLRSFTFHSEQTPLEQQLKLLAIARDRRFDRVGLGPADLDKPFTGEGVVEVEFSFVTLPKVVAILKALPEGAASRVVAKPFNQYVAARITDAQIDELRKATTLPLDFQRYG